MISIIDTENLESNTVQQVIDDPKELQDPSGTQILASFLGEHDLTNILPKLIEEDLTLDILKEMTIEDLRMSGLKAGSAWKLLQALKVGTQDNQNRVSEIFACTFCDQVFTSPEYLKCHSKVHDILLNGDSYNWDKDITTNTSQAIDLSILETFKCDKCIFQTISKSDLESYILNESKHGNKN